MRCLSSTSPRSRSDQLMCASILQPTRCFVPPATAIRCRSGSRLRISSTSCTITRLNDRLNKMLKQSPAEVAEVLWQHRRAFLSAQTLQAWSKLDPAHAKLRDMVREQT